MNEEKKEVRNFIIIFIIVIIAVVGIYFFTKNVVKKDETTDNNTKESETTQQSETSIDPTSAIVGNMLNKSDNNYYVILYKSDSNNVGEYLTIKSSYSAAKDSIPVYTVDLSSGLNSKFYDPDHVNLEVNNINDYRFGEITLLEVKKGSVVKSYTSIEDIKKVWKIS